MNEKILNGTLKVIVLKLIVLIFFSIIFSLPLLGQKRLYPEDLEYKGAFRLPEAEQWEYSGYAMTFYPEGDSSAPEDGYPGSLFILGHDHNQMVAEVAIPAPVISKKKNLDELNRAVILQDFKDIRAGLFGYLEIPRAGLAYLPAQGAQLSAKLYFCWGQHFQDFEPSHGWCELNLSTPKPAGPWYFGDYTNYVTNDYMFTVSNEWADKYTEGKKLVCGRFRDGLWGGRGPALFAFAPWQEGNPPASKARLKKITPLLLYGAQNKGALEIVSDESMSMKFFSEADEWSGASWLEKGDKSAFIFAGTKALGESWYGYANGVRYPLGESENEIYPEMPEWPYNARSWWSSDIEAQFLFYDTDELGETALGKKKPYEPQPYAVLKIDDYLFDPGLNFERDKRYLIGAVCVDSERGILYLVERRADADKSLIHVWKTK